VLVRVGQRDIQRGEALRIALIHGAEPLTLNQLVWQMEELDATRRFQDDVPETARRRLLDAAGRDGITEGARRWMIYGGPVWRAFNCPPSTCIPKIWWICN
jgi:hypothetical protein